MREVSNVFYKYFLSVVMVYACLFLIRCFLLMLPSACRHTFHEQSVIRHENITYPKKKYFRNIFRLPFHDFDFFELILENYPTPIALV